MSKRKVNRRRARLTAAKRALRDRLTTTKGEWIIRDPDGKEITPESMKTN